MPASLLAPFDRARAKFGQVRDGQESLDANLACSTVSSCTRPLHKSGGLSASASGHSAATPLPLSGRAPPCASDGQAAPPGSLGSALARRAIGWQLPAFPGDPTISEASSVAVTSFTAHSTAAASWSGRPGSGRCHLGAGSRHWQFLLVGAVAAYLLLFHLPDSLS